MVATPPLTLLLAVDGSPYSDAAVELVAQTGWPAGTVVHVLTVVPELWSPRGLTADDERLVRPILAGILSKNQAAAERLIARAAERLHDVEAHRGQGSCTIETMICEGRATEGILERAAAVSADLIAVGASGFSTPSELRLGSTAQKVARQARCSVLVARPGGRTRAQRVIVAVDGSPESQRAVDWVRALALPDDAELTVFGVAEEVRVFGADIQRDEMLRGDDSASVQRAMRVVAEGHVKAALDILSGSVAQVRPLVRSGQPAAELVRLAQEQSADLIVIGARGQTRAELHQLGGVAEKVVRFAPGSVLVAR